MTGIEVILLIIGAMIFAASFIFTSKSDTPKNAEIRLSDKQKEDIKNQIMTVFDEQMENLSEQTEIKLDKLSNEKIMEMNDYSETILGEINRNHNEVMFLYDMLNEKKKEINNTVRDLNVVKKEIKEETKQPCQKTRQETVLDQLDAVSESVADETGADVSVFDEQPKKKRAGNAKTAASRARNTVKKETERKDNKDITVFENGNNNEKILEMSRAGKSNMEIAKTLGIGTGEVKLVVDLFKGGR